MPTPHVRSATTGDAPVLAHLLSELGYPSSADELPARLTSVVAGGGAVMVVELESQPVGLAALSVHAALHQNRPVAYITALVVAPEARGRGAGRALVAAAEAWARGLGCARLSVTSAERRADAHAFYPSCGMPYTGRRFTKTLD